jgi:hypothetical protein
MYDFGKPYRKIFIESQKQEEIGEKWAWWLLIIASLYIIAQVIRSLIV